MRIKAKLTINVGVVMLVIGAVTATSIIGMESVKKKLVYLTERSTPFQIRTLEFQKALQGAIADLTRVGGAATDQEFQAFRPGTEKALAEAEKAESAQMKLKGDAKTETSVELKRLADDLFTVTGERLKTEQQASAAGKTITAKLKETSARLKELDRKVRALQAQRSAAYAKSVEETKITARRMIEIQNLKETLKDLQMGIMEIERSDSSKRVIIGRGKANSALDKISRSSYAKQAKSLPADLKELKEKVEELAKTHTALLGQGGGDLKGKYDTLVTAIGDRMNAVAVTIENEDFAAEDKYNVETARQATLLAQMNGANEILLDNAELNALGLSLNSITARILSAESGKDLDGLDAELRGVFGQIDGVAKKLQGIMTKSDAKAELGILRTVQGELGAVRGMLSSADGVVARVRQQQAMREKGRQANERMREIVERQVASGKVTVDTARDEQEKAIIQTNRVVGLSTTLIIAISSAAVCFGIGFGLWIYRSISRPLGELLSLSTAIAGGDLTRRIEVRTRDEVGEVASSLNAMVAGLREMVGRIKGSSGKLAAVAGEITEKSGELTRSAHSQSSAAGDTSSTMVEMAASIQSVAGNADSLASNVSQVSSSVLELGASSQEVAKNAETMAASVGETSTTIEEMTVSIERVAKNGEELFSSVTATSSTVEEMTVSIQQVADNSRELQQIVTETADIITELARSIQQVARHVTEADVVARTASSEGIAGQEAVQSALEAMRRVAGASERTAASLVGLGQRSEEIGSIVNLINEIADQTNLLALNAAIEAARAGDAGKGFAVVADEVRQLAERSVAATREIARIVSLVQTEARESVEYGRLAARESEASMTLSESAGNALSNIVRSIEQTSGLMSEIAGMTAEQAESSSRVLTSVERMNQATSQVANAAREQAQGSRQIRIAVERMSGISQEVAGATHEQAQGSRQIRQAVAHMNEVTRQVTVATQEQASSAKQIVAAVSAMNSMTQSVALATAEQKRGGEMVVQAVENISDMARHNLSSVEHLAASAGELSREAEELAAMVAQFRVE